MLVKNNMFEKENIDLIEYFFRFMISKDWRLNFLEKANIIVNTKYLSMKKSAETLKNDKTCMINLNQIRNFARLNWTPTNTDLHIKSLSSGLLEGHDWHGAMPSFLHLSFQKKVREYCSGSLTLDEYLNIGKDIAKQEFYIVVTHDLCESKIISEFKDSIPSIANKGVTDFIFQNIPYDLKNSSLPKGWSMKEAKNNPLKLAKSLYEGADTERLRKQAENSINDWGVNRFYVIVDDLEQWMKCPEELLKKIVDKSKDLKNPLKFNMEGVTILCHMVFID